MQDRLSANMIIEIRAIIIALIFDFCLANRALLSA